MRILIAVKISNQDKRRCISVLGYCVIRYIIWPISKYGTPEKKLEYTLRAEILTTMKIGSYSGIMIDIITIQFNNQCLISKYRPSPDTFFSRSHRVCNWTAMWSAQRWLWYNSVSVWVYWINQRDFTYYVGKIRSHVIYP